MYVHYEEIIETNPYIDDSTVAKNSLMEADIAKKNWYNTWVAEMENSPVDLWLN